MKRSFKPRNLPNEHSPERKDFNSETELPAKEATAVAILDEGRVEAVTSLSRTTRWRLERRGQFPKRVRLSPGRVGWRQADIEAWISSRAA
jgi:prophage regulatory protein